MPVRRAAPPPPPPSKRTRFQDEEPTRDAVLAVLAERDRELAEAREQQAAVGEVLQAINASSGDLAAAFDSILEKAVRFCDATGGGLWLVEGDVARVVGGSRGTLPRPFLDYVFRAPFPVTDILGRSGHERPFVHIDDLRATRAYQERAPYVVACVELGDMRTALLAPLHENGALVGIITLIRNHARPFTEKQIALVQAFAAQALIAIQNARLFNETQEALERQTATSEILRVISQSPTDARPVFERIVVTAARVLKCDFAAALLRNGDTFSPAATANAQGLLTDFVPASRVPIDPNANFPSRAILGKTMLHLPDWSLIDVPPHERVVQDLTGANSAIYLPLLREDECIGVLALLGTRPNSFGPKEIAQAESFRDQALIAIENARLFRETQEALEQQKASAEVLGAISKSVADTAPVFEAIIDACQRLFGTEEIGIYAVGDDNMVRVAAWRGPRAEEVRHDVTPVGESITGRIIRERRTHHIPDLAAEPDLSPTVRERAERLGSASLLYAPMLSEDRGLGSILVVRSPPKPFSEREKALLQSFADQAAIAIQNARLFNETREALERQTATANVLKVISQSVSDTAPVFETILESCQRLFGLEAVAVYLVEGDMVKGVAHRGWAVGDWGRDATPLASSSTGLAIAERRAIHFPDLADKPDLPDRFKDMLGEAGGMTVLYAPMLWEDRGVGSIVVSRKPAKPFSEKEIVLLQSFADQAAIAIQNARLFEALQAKTRDLEESLAQQTATAEVLKVISRSVLDLDSVLQTLIDTAVRLARGSRGTIFIQRGDVLVASAFHSNVPAELREYLATTTWRLDGDTHPARAAREGRVVHVPDLSKLEDETTQEVRKRAAYGAGLWVPLIGERRTIGVFGVSRDEPVAFTDREIEIVKTFADQAVIAIENARLFGEVQAKSRDLEESLARQTATAEVLKVISRSAFDLNLAASTILEAAGRLCRAPLATLHLRDGDVCRLATQFGLPEAFEREAREHPILVRYPLHSRRTARAGEVAHFSDAWADPEYLYKSSARLGGYRAIVVVP